MLGQTEGAMCESLVRCPHFDLNRWLGDRPFTAGAKGHCRILVGVEGSAEVDYAAETYSLRRGEVLLLPAEVGICRCRPAGQAAILECGLPDF